MNTKTTTRSSILDTTPKTINVLDVLKSMRADKRRPRTNWSQHAKDTLLYNDVAITEFIYLNFYGVYRAFTALHKTKVKTVRVEVDYGDETGKAEVVFHTDALEYHFRAVTPTADQLIEQ